MTNKITKIPQIRFNDFTGDWEQRKLSDLGVIQTGNTPSTSDQENYNEDGILWVTPTDIKNLITNTSAKKLSAKGYTKARIAEPGSILVTCIASIGKNTMVEELSGFNQQINALTPNSLYSSYFLLTQSELWSKKMINSAAAGTMQIFNKTDFSKLSFLYPYLDEQQKIGTFFKSLDDSIALQERKLELLKEQKKGFLQKIFPKNDKKVPEIRFKGFTDDWEQRKVGEFLEESKIPGSDGSIAKKLTVKLWGKGVIPKEEIYKGSASTNYYIRKQGQFIYGKLDFLNQAFGIIPKELDGYESTLDSPAFDILQGLNAKYFLEYVSRKEFYLFQGTIANGSRRAKRIHSDTFFNMPIVLPTIEEQEKIGKFFDTLDHTIALHQRKLEFLKQMKKSFLQKMFV